MSDYLKKYKIALWWLVAAAILILLGGLVYELAQILGVEIVLACFASFFGVWAIASTALLVKLHDENKDLKLAKDLLDVLLRQEQNAHRELQRTRRGWS